MQTVSESFRYGLHLFFNRVIILKSKYCIQMNAKKYNIG